MYDVRLKVYDSQGCSDAFVYTGQSTTCPGGFGTLASAGLDKTLPFVLSRLQGQEPPRRFPSGGRGASRKPRRGHHLPLSP